MLYVYWRRTWCTHSCRLLCGESVDREPGGLQSASGSRGWKEVSTTEQLSTSYYNRQWYLCTTAWVKWIREWQTWISDRQNTLGNGITRLEWGSFLAFGFIAIKYYLKILSEMIQMFALKMWITEIQCMRNLTDWRVNSEM